MPEPQPAPVVCEEKRELMEAALAGMDRIRTLTERITEDWKRTLPTLEGVERFSEDFERVVRFHQSLLERYDTHVRTHGC